MGSLKLLRPRLLVVLFVLSLSGCESDRISKLENRIQQLESKQQSSSLALQEQCAKQAQLEFARDGFDVEPKTRYHFTDHYNSTLNKCLIEEFALDSSLHRTSRHSDIFVSDVFEHKQYAVFTAPLHRGEKPLSCEVTTLSGSTAHCGSEEEFDTLVRQYME